MPLKQTHFGKTMIVFAGLLIWQVVPSDTEKSQNIHSKTLTRIFCVELTKQIKVILSKKTGVNNCFRQQNASK